MSAVAYDTSGPFAVITSQGSPGTWSIFSCRALVSIQLPSTVRCRSPCAVVRPCGRSCLHEMRADRHSATITIR